VLTSGQDRGLICPHRPGLTVDEEVALNSRIVAVFMCTVIVFSAFVLINWEGRKIAPAPAAGKVKVKAPVTATVAKR
jgi:hypothetical protein